MYANAGKPWSLSVPVDARLGRAASCELSVGETHNFEGAPNAY
jgi:hypothetical protein